MSDMNQLTWLLGFPLATLLWSWPRSSIAGYLGQPPEKKNVLQSDQEGSIASENIQYMSLNLQE